MNAGEHGSVVSSASRSPLSHSTRRTLEKLRSRLVEAQDRYLIARWEVDHKSVVSVVSVISASALPDYYVYLRAYSRRIAYRVLVYVVHEYAYALLS